MTTKPMTATRVAAAAVWFLACAAVLWSDSWEPLAGWIGGVAILLATVALGLALRWWAVPVVALGLPAVAVGIRPPDESLETFMLLCVGAPMCAAVAAISAFAARWLRGPRPAQALVGVPAALIAVGLVLNARTVDHHPESPLVVDLQTGALASVRPGAGASGLRARFGREIVTRDLMQMAPLGESARDFSGPSSLDGGFEIHRYDDIAVFVRRDRIVGYITTDRNVELGRGVGVGDSISLIEERGLPLRCFDVSLGSDAVRPSHPACTTSLPGGRELGAGGDPIDSIWVVR